MFTSRSSDCAVGDEELLLAEAEAIDQAVQEEVGWQLVERPRGAAVEPEKTLDSFACIRRGALGFTDDLERRDHVGLPAAGDLGRARKVHRAELDRRASQRPDDGAGVVRIGEQPQPRQQVSHLGAVEERSGAGDPERDARAPRAPPRQLAPSLRAERTRIAVSPGSTPSAISDSSSAATACACARSFSQRQKRTGSRELRRRRGLQLLGKAIGARSDDRVGRIQDRLTRAVVGLEADDLGVREVDLEVGDVLARGAPEAVDRLVVVADDHDVAMLADEQAQQLALGEVRVLVLVHEHVAEALRDAPPDAGPLLEQPEGAQDQLAEVERAGLGQEPVVVGVEARELELALNALVVLGSSAASACERAQRS